MCVCKVCTAAQIPNRHARRLQALATSNEVGAAPSFLTQRRRPEEQTMIRDDENILYKGTKRARESSQKVRRENRSREEDKKSKEMQIRSQDEKTRREPKIRWQHPQLPSRLNSKRAARAALLPCGWRQCHAALQRGSTRRAAPACLCQALGCTAQRAVAIGKCMKSTGASKMASNIAGRDAGHLFVGSNSAQRPVPAALLPWQPCR